MIDRLYVAYGLVALAIVAMLLRGDAGPFSIFTLLFVPAGAFFCALFGFTVALTVRFIKKDIDFWRTVAVAIWVASLAFMAIVAKSAITNW